MASALTDVTPSGREVVPEVIKAEDTEERFSKVTFFLQIA